MSTEPLPRAISKLFERNGPASAPSSRISPPISGSFRASSRQTQNSAVAASSTPTPVLAAPRPPPAPAQPAPPFGGRPQPPPDAGPGRCRGRRLVALLGPLLAAGHR